MNKTKSTIIISFLIIVLSLAVLTATTLAWFTDSETNKGNLIVAGSLEIDAIWYELAEQGDEGTTATYSIKDYGSLTFATDEGDKTSFADSGKLINESNWQPAIANAKLITVTNKGSLDAVIALSAEVTKSGLEGALWFDFVAVGSDGVTGGFNQRDMEDLADLLAYFNGEKQTLSTGESMSFILIYGMSSDANNDYQSKDYELSITVSASQTNYVADSAV